MSDNSFINSARVEFSRKTKFELQLTQNLLRDVFTIKGNIKDKQKVFDFVGKINTRRITYGTGDPNANGTGADTNKAFNAADTESRRLSTPTGQTPPYRRVITAFKAGDTHVHNNRIDAKTKGISVADQGRTFGTLIKAAKARDELNMMIDFCTDSYKGQAEATGTTAAILNAFPSTQRLIPNLQSAVVTAANGTYNRANPANTANFHVGDIMHINSLFDNALEQNHVGRGRIMNSLDGMKKVAIFTVSGWKDFVTLNYPFLANSDWFGKPVMINGYGYFNTLMDFIVITVPDGHLPAKRDEATGFVGNFGLAMADYNKTTYDSGPFKVANAATVVSDDTENKKVFPDGSAYLTNDVFHRALFLYVDTMHFMIPEQLDVPLQVYRDKDESFEWAAYCSWALEATRLYNDVVYEVYFTKQGKSVTVTS